MAELTLNHEPMFPRKALLRLIIPLVIEQLLAVTIGMADTVMVTSTGEAAVSGISLVDSINILLIQIFSALATGGAVVAAQYLGRREHQMANQAAKQLIYASTGVALVVTLFSLLLRNWILRLVFGNIDPEVMANAQTYFWLSALSYPFLALYNAGAALFRAMGNSKVSMLTSLVMNLVNICGNAMLIYGFGWGVAGAGAASLVSRALGAVVMTVLICKPRNVIHTDQLWRITFKPQMVRNILRLGIPNGLENGMFQVGKLIVQGLVATLGTASIAANAIANSLTSLAIIPGAAIGMGMVTVVSQCVGARDYDQAMGYTKKLMGITYLATGGLNLFVFLLAGPLVGLFNLSEAAATLATQVVRTYSAFCIFIWPAAFTMPNALRAAGDAKFTMTVSVFSMWLFRVGCCYLMIQLFHIGLMGAWYAMYIDWIFRAIVFFIRLRSGKWKSAKVID